ncbi:MAG: hypothetical protein K8T90_22235, partial [Planctomycetes bacterium]|nr:hypothetical protein [Planctomycetota bacterium]
AQAAMSARAQLGLAMSLRLPPLPIPAVQLSAMASAVAQIKAGFGVNLLAPGAAAQLSLTVRTMAMNLGSLGIGPASLPTVPPVQFIRFAGQAAGVMSLTAALGLPALAAGGALQLQAALDALATVQIPMPAIPPAVATLSAAASLAAALGIDLGAPGGIPQLVAAIQFLIAFPVPTFTFPLLPLAALAEALAAMANLEALTGVRPGLPGFNVAFQARMAPLFTLPNLRLDARLAAVAAAGAAWAPLLPLASVKLSATANFSALARLPMPPLPAFAPLVLAANLAAAAGGAQPSACAPSCPLVVHV